MTIRRAHELGREALSDDAALVITELVTNAFLHGGGYVGMNVTAAGHGLRLEVRDRNRVPPLLGHASEESLTGRGMRVVASLASRWGAEVRDDGKVVWAELSGDTTGPDHALSAEDLIAMWEDERIAQGNEPRFHVELGDVPTHLLLSAKSHVDNVVREFALASAGARSGLTEEVPPHLAALLDAVVDRFSEARLSIKHQALEAAGSGAPRTRLALDLPASAADAAQEYVAALDEVDTYCRAMRLLTLETPPQHRIFRQWYIGELVAQLRAAAAGERPPEPEPFDRRLLAELDRLASSGRASERAARLYAVAAAFATAATPEAVAAAVLNEGVEALGASGGGVLLATAEDTLSVPGVVGYDELPAAVALRTRTSVWLESRVERDRRFPKLAGMEATTVALCAVPLEVQGRCIGALRFSFTEARLFDDEERRFITALAAQAAQAMDRAQLQRARLDVSRRLQQSLLPPKVPEIPRLDLAVLYHPFGDGIEIGGDFYDVWQIGEGRWAIAIGDVAGTGPEAAAITAVARHTVRALTMVNWEPEQIIRGLNTALYNAAAEDEHERFCTVIFGVVTTDDVIRVNLASGGHPPVTVRRADGTVEDHVVGGTLLGVFPEPSVGRVELTLEPGDTLLFVTDGVLEARRDGVLFDSEGVKRVLTAGQPTALTTITHLEQAVLAHTGGVLADDMAAVVLRVPS